MAFEIEHHEPHAVLEYNWAREAGMMFKNKQTLKQFKGFVDA